MNIWEDNTWHTYINAENSDFRSGLRLRFDAGVDGDVRSACIKFAKWLRREYSFPVRIPIYVKSSERIKAHDGDMVCGTFFWPHSTTDEPYARIATGDYRYLCGLWGENDAIASVLWSLAHELTHYFQWLNQIEQSEIDEEKQAERTANEVMGRYAATVDSFI